MNCERNCVIVIQEIKRIKNSLRFITIIYMIVVVCKYNYHVMFVCIVVSYNNYYGL